MITSKLKAMWDPRDPVTPEDINHLKNRVEQFTATVALRKKDLKTIPPCKYCFCKQLVEQSAAFTTQLPQEPAALSGPLAAQAEQAGPSSAGVQLHMMDWLQDRARLSDDVVRALTADVLALGALSVQELHPEDWEALPSWPRLKPFEQRRLLKAVE